MSSISPPLVSIITPTYNHEKYISQCIESVLAQSYPNWEQIIIDDGSTDCTREVISGCMDSRIRYYHQENLGAFKLAETYNRALRLAQGELIAYLEGDDFWPYDKLETQVKCFEDPRVILSFGRVVHVSAKGKVLAERGCQHLPSAALTNDPLTTATVYYLEEKLRFHPVTMLIRRSALERIGGFQSGEGLPFVDIPTILNLSLQGQWRYINRVLGFWRRRISSVAHSYSLDTVNNLKKFAINFYMSHQDRLVTKADISKSIIARYDRLASLLVILHGRKALYRQEWTTAKKLFWQAYRIPSDDWREFWVTNTLAIIGVLCALLRVNAIELLFKWKQGHTITDLVE